jgi:hypothetical protein
MAHRAKARAVMYIALTPPNVIKGVLVVEPSL